MGQYIAELLRIDAQQARRIQKDYFREHGTTLAGLMRFHDVDPHEFLNFVHDVDLSAITPQPQLAQQIARLPGRKYIFTNADAPYARRILEKMGLFELFSDIQDIHKTRYQPKPEITAYRSMLENFEINPEESVFFEDMARNLKPAKTMGLATIWINNGAELGGHEHDEKHIDLTANSIDHALEMIHEQSLLENHG